MRRDMIDPTKSHDQAMKMLEEAGIYVLFVRLPLSIWCSAISHPTLSMKI